MFHMSVLYVSMFVWKFYVYLFLCVLKMFYVFRACFLDVSRSFYNCLYIYIYVGDYCFCSQRSACSEGATRPSIAKHIKKRGVLVACFKQGTNKTKQRSACLCYVAVCFGCFCFVYRLSIFVEVLYTCFQHLSRHSIFVYTCVWIYSRTFVQIIYIYIYVFLLYNSEMCFHDVHIYIYVCLCLLFLLSRLSILL